MKRIPPVDVMSLVRSSSSRDRQVGASERVLRKLLEEYVRVSRLLPLIACRTQSRVAPFRLGSARVRVMVITPFQMEFVKQCIVFHHVVFVDGCYDG
jgi:hypothetical protein